MSLLQTFFTSWLSGYDKALIISYLVVFVALAVYGFHRSQLVYLYYRYRSNRPEPLGRLQTLPKVTVQLPLFNEMYVAPRLLESVAKIRYPRELLEIQVLDDSTDETQELCKRKVEELRKTGIDITYVHRTDRTGFKAGALENGLKTAKGEFILVFDADFLPHADILERTIHFFSDPKIGDGAGALGSHQPRLLGADRGAGADAGWPLCHRAHRASPLGPLL
jgi:cellulose synthase/poly-beta-1,6-N-acetylglucosamine synthase-like glycosyltransferase